MEVRVEKLRVILFPAIAVIFSIFQIYMCTLGKLDPLLFRIIHLYFALVLTFLIVPQTKTIPFVDRIANNISLVITALTGIYLLIMWSSLVERFPLIHPLPEGGIFFGILFLVVLLDALRRLMGKELVIVVIVIIAYTLYGKYTYGIFRHLGYSLEDVIDVAYLSTEGTFGETLGISANYLFLYILFGSFLVRSGVGEIIIDLGKAFVGHRTGGAGKLAVIATAGFGMISGSAVASVLTVGSFTIPFMKSMGYKAIHSGAIVAIGSTGGMIMPPVMGAVAFLMAQYLGIPYGQVVIYAFLPALLYYFCLYASTHFEAKRLRLPVLSKDQLPHPLEVLRKGWYLLIPILLLIVFLMKQYSAALAALVAIFSNIILMLVSPRKRFRERLLDIILALKEGARDALMIVVALAVANLIEGLISITGVALKISSVLVQVSPNVFVLLGLAAGTLFILGLALPSFVIYITAVPILVPPLVKFGLDPVAVHFFLVYWAVLSMITPPTGGSFYAAAGVAQAPVMRVGWMATRIAAPVYLLTFMLAIHPALLLRGAHAWETLYYIVPAFISVVCMAAANSGFLFQELRRYEKVLLVAVGILFMYASPWSLFLGVIALIAVVYSQRTTVIVT